MEATGAEKGMFSEAEYNPVGSYIKYFDLDKSMCGKRIHICFEGVEEAMYLWLNGQFVGYAEDSFTPSEFDLTPYIKEKGNVLAVQVHKMSTAAFLEDQDFFRFFGIFRNVTLKRNCQHESICTGCSEYNCQLYFKRQGRKFVGRKIRTVKERK